MMIVKDAIGVEITDGDCVVYLDTWVRKLKLDTVMYLTPKGARIMPCDSDAELNRPSKYLIKVEDYDA